MLPAIVPVALLAGLGVIALVASQKKDGAAAPPADGSAPVMSPQMKSAFQALLAGSDPDAMEASANALEPFGFLSEAKQLRTQAAALRKARLSGVQSPAAPAPLPQLPAPSVIPSTVTPTPSPVAVRDLGDVDAPDFLQGGVTPVPSSLAQQVSAPAAALPSFAVVTTSDPAPAGDLMIRPAPNAAGTPGVGAEKDGIVMVVRKDVLGDGVWSEVVWAGGSRLPPASGFVKSAFLRPSAVGPQGTAIAGDGDGDGSVVCVAPSGCRLRKGPSTMAEPRAIIGNGESVKVLSTVTGQKLEAFSPGRGGWAKVAYKGLQGWMPLEWLVNS